MASALDSWWTLNFHKYSIRDLSQLPIYHRFLQLRFAFELVTPQRTERFTPSSSADVYEWSESDRSERFTYNKDKHEHGYEVTYSEQSHSVSVATWANRDSEWGSIVKTFPMWQLRETWKSTSNERAYERMTEEQGVVRGVRCGAREDGERWVEEIWQQPGESVLKKTWEKPGQSGGDTRMTREGSSWGEEWISDTERMEKKRWHEEHDRRWGSGSGRVGKDMRWEHAWDFAAQTKFEQKLSHTAGRTVGYRFKQTGEDWTKEEWDGADTPLVVDVSTVCLERLYEKEYVGAMESDRTLRMMNANDAENSEKISRFAQTIDKIHSLDRKDAADFLARIEELRDLQSEQEALKQALRQSEEIDWKQMSNYVANSKEQANDSLETLFALAKVVQTDEFDTEVTKSKKEVKSLISADGLTLGGQISSWKSAIATMESLKRDHLRYLQKTLDPQSASELTLRKQELDNCIKSAYHTFTRIYDIAWELNLLAGDEDRQVVLEGLKRRFDGGQAECGVAQLRSLLAALRSFSSIQGELMEGLRRGVEGKDISAVGSEIGLSIAELGKRLVGMADLTEEEQAQIDLGIRKAKGMSVDDPLLCVKKTLSSIQGVLSRAEYNAKNGIQAKNILPEILLETEKLSESMSVFVPSARNQLAALKQQTTFSDTHVPDLLSSLDSYISLLEKLTTEITASLQIDHFWNHIMKELEPISTEIHEAARVMGQFFPENDTKIASLHQSASVLFSEYHQSPNRDLILKEILAIKSFLPLILDLAKRLITLPKPSNDFRSSEGSSETQLSISDAMSTLESLHTELHEFASALTAIDSTYTSHLQILSSEVRALFEEFRISPQCFILPRTISAIRAYSPLLKALGRKAKDEDKAWTDSSCEAAMCELEIAATEVSQLANDLSESDSSFDFKLKSLQKDLETTFSDHHAAPQNGDLLAATRGIRCYFPTFKELIRSAGLRAAMDMLKSVVDETHKFALSLADDPELAAKLPLLEANAHRPFEEFNRSPKRLCFQTALKTLQAYHPVMVIYWWKRGMRAMSDLTSEFDLIISRFFPQHADSLFVLRDKSSILFSSYKTDYVPNNFLQAVQLLTAYHRLLMEGCDEPFIPSPDMSHIPVLPSEPSEHIPMLEASASDIKQAESILESEKGEAVMNNILIQSLQKANVPTDKPLTYLNIFKFFEELMDKKFEVDAQDLAAFRKPRGMTEFLMEHLNRQFGIKSLAMKFLGQLLPGLNILFTEKNPYAVLFARLLQVFHPDPISFPLAMFLTRIRPEFHKLIEKCTREREVREKRSMPLRKTVAKTPVTYGRAAYDLAASGGEAFTSDVITLMYDLFDNDSSSGELALKLLRPEAVSLVDYVLFKVCHKMAKMGMSPDGVFNMIDSDGGGSIDQDEFVKGIKSSLELWISEVEIIEVHTAVAVNGQMSRNAFLSRCNFDWYQLAAKSEEYITTKCEFLNVLIDVFNRKQRDDTAQLVALFASKRTDAMTRELFWEIIRELDPSNPEDRIETIWQCGFEQSGDSVTGLSQVAFVKCMLKYPTGQFARTKFCNR